MARLSVKTIPDGEVSADGQVISVNIELKNGVNHTLVMPYLELDIFLQTILGLSAAAANRLKENNIEPPAAAIEPVIPVLNFRVLVDSASQQATLQIIGRAGETTGPLAMASFRFDAQQLGGLSARLTEALIELRPASDRH